VLRLIYNREDAHTLGEELCRLLARADGCLIHVAYCRESGLDLLWPCLTDFAERGGKMRLLTGGDFAQTEPDALQRLRDLDGCEPRLVSSSGIHGYHPKCYVTYTGTEANIIVGSSNLTAGGLSANIELNLCATVSLDDLLLANVERTFDTLWDLTPPLTDEVLADYRRFWQQAHDIPARLVYRVPEEEPKVETTPEPDFAVGDMVIVNEQLGEVVAVDTIGDKLSVGVGIEGVGIRKFLCPPTVIQKAHTPMARLKAGDFDPPEHFALLTEATRLSLAHAHDRLVSLSNSRTKLEPYQVQAVHKVISAWDQRFLIADDVGLGKTVEAGMVMRELAARERADKVLIVAPAGLVLQWRREMSEKFDERFEVLNSSKLREWRSTRPAGEELSTRYPRAVVSLDLAKMDVHTQDFGSAPWDIVIFDEAHKVARRGYGETTSLRHKLAEDIAPNADSLLLLSATPHDGNPEAFHSLISLLDPFLVADPYEITPEQIHPITIRRGKMDIKDEDGNPLFPPRHVDTTAVTFTSKELQLYQAVTDYVRYYYKLAEEMRNTAVGFVMVLLQKRMVSSIHAIRCSLERRLIALKHPEAAVLTQAELRELREKEEDEEALSDAEREELQRKLETARLTLGEPQRHEEIARVTRLVEMAKVIEIDSKARELQAFVGGVLERAPHEKILIFTEYTDTLDYLREEVLSDFEPIAVIHGGMDMETRQQQEDHFKEPQVRLMLATDAAGEGINLQFCHLMVNYELPWNPNRIEQRIGRLHRYGQDHDVRVYNLQVTNTREGQILSRLLEKMEKIEQQLGGYVPNILGVRASNETVNLDKLSDLMMDALSGDTEVEVTLEAVEQALDERQKMYEQVEQDLFMPLHSFDLGRAQRLISRSNELAPSNADIEAFTRLFFDTHDGRIGNTRKAGVVQLRTPRHIVGNDVLAKYPRATFDKEVAYQYRPGEVDFIAFGHPLLHAIVRDCTENSTQASGTASVKVSHERSGLLCNYLLRFADANDETVREELLPLFVSDNGEVSEEVGRELLHAPTVGQPDGEHVQRLLSLADALEGMAQEVAAERAQAVYADIEEERERQAEASLESLNRFEKARREKLQQSILDFQQRLLGGEDMDIAIRRAESNIERLEDECEQRRRRIEARRAVQAEEPKLLNVAVVAAGGAG
jgi:HKD family nuclease/ERCC4-related helicase